MVEHPESARGTRGIGRTSVKELECKGLKISNKSIRRTQEALATTGMTPEEDPYNCVNGLTRLRKMLNEMEEPITDRRFKDIDVQHMMEEYWNFKIMA